MAHDDENEENRMVAVRVKSNEKYRQIGEKIKLLIASFKMGLEMLETKYIFGPLVIDNYIKINLSTKNGCNNSSIFILLTLTYILSISL